MRGFKTGNEYADILTQYARIPKAVLAAIAVSYASAGGDNLADAERRVLEEWRILHENGIVPQACTHYTLPETVDVASSPAGDRPKR